MMVAALATATAVGMLGPSATNPWPWMLVPMAAALVYAVERLRVARSAPLAGARSAGAFRSLVASALADGRLNAPASPLAPPRDVTIEPEGDLWRVEWKGTTIRARHSRGVALLAHLVRSPGQDIHVADLDAITPSGASRSPEVGVVLVQGDAGEILDSQARSDYRRRLAELRADLAEAESRNDLGRIETLRAEQELLEEELRVAVGVGGRPRRASSDAERLRVAITHRIRNAIAQIGKSHPELGAHLRASVSTGYRCVYQPPVRASEDERAGDRERKA
jgi:hypothetical protein